MILKHRNKMLFWYIHLFFILRQLIILQLSNRLDQSFVFLRSNFDDFHDCRFLKRWWSHPMKPICSRTTCGPPICPWSPYFSIMNFKNLNIFTSSESLEYNRRRFPYRLFGSFSVFVELRESSLTNRFSSCIKFSEYFKAFIFQNIITFISS